MDMGMPVGNIRVEEVDDGFSLRLGDGDTKK